MKKSYLLLTLTIISLLGIAHISAQPAIHHPERPGRPGFEDSGKIGPGNKPGPEDIKKHQKQQTIMAIAEAHKELATIYSAQNRYDDAIEELKKILQLFADTSSKIDDKHQMQAINKVLPVYHQIAKLYLKSDRFDEAEKFVIESIAKFETTNPQIAARMTLQLGKLYKRADKLDKAEEAYKRVLELNQNALENDK